MFFNLSIFKNWKKIQMFSPFRCFLCDVNQVVFYIYIRISLSLSPALFVSFCLWWIKIQFHKNMPFVMVTHCGGWEMSTECVRSAQLGIQIDTINSITRCHSHLSYLKQRQMTDHQCHLSKSSRDSIIYLSQQLSDWGWTREKNTKNKNPFLRSSSSMPTERKRKREIGTQKRFQVVSLPQSITH